MAINDKLTKEQITEILNKEFEQFQNSVYEGVVPENLIQRFINGIMTLPPHGHRVLTSLIKRIVAKTEDQLTVEEVGVCIKIVLNVSWDKLYADMHEALEKHSEIEIFAALYNRQMDEFTAHLTNRQKSMIKLGIAPAGNTSMTHIIGGQKGEA